MWVLLFKTFHPCMLSLAISHSERMAGYCNGKERLPTSLLPNWLNLRRSYQYLTELANIHWVIDYETFGILRFPSLFFDVYITHNAVQP